MKFPVKDYQFPEGVGSFTGALVMKKWGKRGALICYFDTEDEKRYKICAWFNHKDAFVVSHRLEIINCCSIDVDGNLLLQTRSIRVLSGIQFVDVVFFSHKITLASLKISMLLVFGCLSCRDNTNYISAVTVTMAYNTDFSVHD